MGNIVNGRGVPLAAPRSDDWIIEETPVKIASPADMPADNAGRYIANQIRKELEQADLERRLKEAGATITELKPALEKARAGGKKKSAADAGKGEAGAEKKQRKRFSRNQQTDQPQETP